MGLSDPVLVGLVGLASVILGNLIIGWVQLKRVPAQNKVDDASVATAYAELNRQLRQQIEGMEKRITELENLRVAPIRAIVDIATYPEPHIINSTVGLVPQPRLTSEASDQKL